MRLLGIYFVAAAVAVWSGGGGRKAVDRIGSSKIGGPLVAAL
jgi:hypothetical protein